MYYRVKDNKLYDWAEWKYDTGCKFTDICTEQELFRLANHIYSKYMIEDGELKHNPTWDKKIERINSIKAIRRQRLGGTNGL